MTETQAVQIAWSGEKLKAMREDHDWSLADLRDLMAAAGAAPRYPQTIGTWERGMQPEAKYVTAMCRVFETSPDAFYD